jgi:hypothetical protein
VQQFSVGKKLPHSQEHREKHIQTSKKMNVSLLCQTKNRKKQEGK